MKDYCDRCELGEVLARIVDWAARRDLPLPDDGRRELWERAAQNLAQAMLIFHEIELWGGRDDEFWRGINCADEATKLLWEIGEAERASGGPKSPASEWGQQISGSAFALAGDWLGALTM
jgi:hypothetical protein